MIIFVHDLRDSFNGEVFPLRSQVHDAATASSFRVRSINYGKNERSIVLRIIINYKSQFF